MTCNTGGFRCFFRQVGWNKHDSSTNNQVVTISLSMETSEYFSAEISFFAYRRTAKAFIHSLIFGRSLWRNPIACTTLLELRRLESFADLRALMECIRTSVASSTSSSAQFGRSFAFTLLLYSLMLKMMTNIFWKINTKTEISFESNLRLMRYWNFWCSHQ